MRRACTLAALIVAATMGAVPTAQAKITCDGAHPVAAIQLDGVPAAPAVDTEYRARFEVPRAPHANPWPVAMFIRCGGAHDYPSFAVDLHGAGRVEVPLRFSEPGRWRANLMDRGGTFHSLGTFDVVPAADDVRDQPGPSASGGDATVPMLALAGAALLGAALLRRRARARSPLP